MDAYVSSNGGLYFAEEIGWFCWTDWRFANYLGFLHPYAELTSC